MRLAMLLALALSATSAIACSCVGGGPKTSFKWADAVFEAEVVEYDADTARLRPLRFFKGEPVEFIDVYTRDNSAACGYGEALTPGSRHLIYAAQHDTMPYLEVSLCGGSKPLERASCDLAYLRSRAAWWRSPLSSLRILERLGIRRDPCS